MAAAQKPPANPAMPDVLVQFDEPQAALDGTRFVAQVNGRRRPDGLWEGWIEFAPCDGGDPVCTSGDTEQLTRGDLRYWAAHMTRGYLSKALELALSGRRVPSARATGAVLLDDEWPREHAAVEADMLRSAAPVVDPVEVYRRGGEHALRNELRALNARELGDIILQLGAPEIDVHHSVRTFEDALVERVVARVQQVGGHRHTSAGSQPTETV